MFTWKSSSKQDECFQYLKLPHAIPGQAYKISEIQKQKHLSYIAPEITKVQEGNFNSNTSS